MHINHNFLIFRPDFDASREKLRKLGDAEGTLTKEEFNKMKQELEAEYLATFKKTVAMHETFLCRLARCVLTIFGPVDILKKVLPKLYKKVYFFYFCHLHGMEYKFPPIYFLKLLIQLKKSETAPNLSQLSQNLTLACSLISVLLPVFTSFCMM